MSVTPSASTNLISKSSAIPAESVWRLSVEQYHQMIHTGILTEEDPIELLAGFLIQKMPKNPPHRIVTKLVRDALEAIVSDGFYVDSQEPITLEDSEPEPDVVIVRGNTRDYVDCHPTGKDIELVVEVSESTLERDRGVKRQIYSKAGISIYWLINLQQQCIEVYSDLVEVAEGLVYQNIQVYYPPDFIPVSLKDLELGRLSVKELLP